MKKRKDWLSQERLDRELDRLVAEQIITMDDPNFYDAAEELGASPSGSFYKKGRDWHKRRKADEDAPLLLVSPAIEAEIRGMFEAFAAKAAADVVSTLARVGGEIDRTATIRVVDADQRRARAESEIDKLAEEWSQTEGNLERAIDRIHELEDQLAAADREATRLKGRLEEQERLLEVHILRGGSPAENAYDLNVTAVSERVAPAVDEAAGSETDASDVPGDAGSEEGNQTQPLASEDDQPKQGRPELPLVSKEKADEA